MLTMKAVRLHRYGGPEVLVYEDAPRPVPGDGEALVRVHAASVNAVDWKVRAGCLEPYLPHRLPLIPGWDLSGVVEALGPEAAGVDAGDEVYTRADVRRDGTYADYAIVRAADLAPRPLTVDHVHAAALPMAGLTAYQALFHETGIALTEGQTVLIHGGAGGVGHLAVQLAHGRGARVIATASANNQRFLRELGADEVLDYNSVRFEDVVHGVDAVLDTIGGETLDRSWGVLRRGGVLASIAGQPSEELATAYGVRAAALVAQTRPADLTELARLIDLRRLRVVVSQVFPLAEARRAHELSQTGHVRGKLALRVV